MSTTQHTPTPGPWIVGRNGELPDRPFTVGKLFYCVADVGNEADARLIASAPTLDAENKHLVVLNTELVKALTDLTFEISHHLQSGDRGALVQNAVRNACMVLSKVEATT